MMKRLTLAFVACLCAGAARAESLVTSLSTHQVAITSNYTGSQVVLFGAIQRDAQTIARTTGYDAVITVRGPRQSLTVREKGAMGPIWINREQQKFAGVPVYFAVLSSQPLAEVTGDILRQRYRIGLSALVNSSDLTFDRGGVDEPFREALVRLKKQEGLFFEQERGVTFLTPSIFRSAIRLPAAAPPGNYQVEILLFADDILLARDQTDFELVKIGFEQRIADLAENAAPVYGAATAAVALLLGWLANVIFRRD